MLICKCVMRIDSCVGTVRSCV